MRWIMGVEKSVVRAEARVWSDVLVWVFRWIAYINITCSCMSLDGFSYPTGCL